MLWVTAIKLDYLCGRFCFDFIDSVRWIFFTQIREFRTIVFYCKYKWMFTLLDSKCTCCTFCNRVPSSWRNWEVLPWDLVDCTPCSDIFFERLVWRDQMQRRLGLLPFYGKWGFKQLQFFIRKDPLYLINSLFKQLLKAHTINYLTDRNPTRTTLPIHAFLLLALVEYLFIMQLLNEHNSNK